MEDEAEHFGGARFVLGRGSETKCSKTPVLQYHLNNNYLIYNMLNMQTKESLNASGDFEIAGA